MPPTVLGARWRWTPRARLVGRTLAVTGVAAAAAALVAVTLPGSSGGSAAGAVVVGPSAAEVAALAASPQTEESLRGRAASRAARSGRILSLPVTPPRMSARFGERGSHWRYRHTGLDFNVDWGTPVRSPMDGVVIKRAFQKAYGNVLVIRRSDRVDVWYCHLSRMTVRKGQRVATGQVVGAVGSTGNSTGAHLHMEVRVHDRPTDPHRFLFGPNPGTPGPVASWVPPGFMPLSIL